MTKEQYIQSRNQNQIDMQLAYQMYVETPHPTPKLPPQYFQQLFQMFLQMSNLDNYFKYWDNKFEVNFLRDKGGNVVKIF